MDRKLPWCVVKDKGVEKNERL